MTTASLGPFGRYQLLDVLARGAVGEVFRAHDSATGRVVALTVLPAQLTEDDEYVQRFRREVHAAAELNDPHVVPVHHFGEIDGRLYVDMELIEGHDLAGLIAAGGRLHPRRAIAIVEQVASALDSAHRAGLAHRDVNPTNIVVAANDSACLTGFGIAPNGAGPRDDIYALTCVLFECLTGQRPYPGAAPSTIWPDLPPALDTVIARGMAETYQTATELAASARASLTNAATRPPPSRRLRLTRYLVALMAVLMCASLVVVLLLGHRPSPDRIAREGGTRVRLTAVAPDGSKPNQDTLSQAERVITARVHGLVTGGQVAVDGNRVVVTVPGHDSGELRDIGSLGRLYLRPVVHSIPAQPSQPGQQPSTPPNNDRVAQERQLRQSTSQALQMLALQYQATRCGKDDALAGNDDPKLPLVTCSQDASTAFILGPSILGNDQIDSATSNFSKSGIGYVVDLKFKADAAQTWADYTAAHIGTQVAFTLDSEVVRAPSINEAISGDRTQISGGNPPFTAQTARQLANVLNYRPLPLKFVASPPETIPPQPHSDPSDLASDLMHPPGWMIAAAFGVLLSLICALVCLSVPGIRRHLRF